MRKSEPGIRVLVADDHPVVCMGLSAMIAGQKDFRHLKASKLRRPRVRRRTDPTVIKRIATCTIEIRHRTRKQSDSSVDHRQRRSLATTENEIAE